MSTNISVKGGVQSLALVSGHLRVVRTEVEVSETIVVVGHAGADHVAEHVPRATRRVHGGSEHDGTRHVAEHADRKLDHAHRHRFICKRPPHYY